MPIGIPIGIQYTTVVVDGDDSILDLTLVMQWGLGGIINWPNGIIMSW